MSKLAQQLIFYDIYSSKFLSGAVPPEDAPPEEDVLPPDEDAPPPLDAPPDEVPPFEVEPPGAVPPLDTLPPLEEDVPPPDEDVLPEDVPPDETFPPVEEPCPEGDSFGAELCEGLRLSAEGFGVALVLSPVLPLEACEELQLDFGCVPSTKYAVVEGQVFVAKLPEYVHISFSTIFDGFASSFFGKEE